MLKVRYQPILIVLSTLILFSSPRAQAQGTGWERERVAIFFADSRQASCATPQDMVYLTQLLEEQFLRLLPKDRYVLIQGADLITLMQAFSSRSEKETACSDQSCAQIARRAQAKIYLEQRFDCARGQVTLTLKRLNEGAVELVEQARLSLDDVGRLATSKGEEKVRKAAGRLIGGLGVQITEKRRRTGNQSSTLEVVKATGGVQEGRRGILLVDCNAPQARVLLDRKSVGQIGPDGIFQKPVRSGKYRLRIDHPLYAAVEQNVTVPAGPMQLRVTLEPNFGSLKVVTMPMAGARITLERDSVGLTPKIIQRLPARSMRVRVEHPLFKTVRRQVRIRSQTRTELRIEMERKMGDVVVMTRPPGAQLFFESLDEPDKTHKGTTPFAKMLPSGRYRVIVSKTGYGSQVKDMKVSERREVTERWNLVKANIVRVVTPGVEGVVVRLGEEPAQKSPANFSVVPGTYILGVEDPRFAKSTKKVVVPNGGLDRQVELYARKRPEVAFSGKPVGATVRIGGQKCQSPCTLTPEAGQSCYNVSKPGYLAAEQCKQFQAGANYRASYKLQDDSAVGRRSLEKRRLRRNVDGLSQWTVLGPMIQGGNSLPGPGAADRGFLPRGLGLSYRRRFLPELSTRMWISSSPGGMTNQGMLGKEAGLEVLLRSSEGVLSLGELGLGYQWFDTDGQAMTARLRYIMGERLELSPSLRIHSDSSTTTYGLQGRLRLTDRLALSGGLWMPPARSSDTIQSYNLGVDWRWLGYDHRGRADRDFDSTDWDGWLAPVVYCIPPTGEIMSTRQGTSYRFTRGCFGVGGMHWITKRFGLGGTARLASMAVVDGQIGVGFGANGMVFLRPSDRGILGASELRLIGDGEFFISRMWKFEGRGELMFGLGDGWRIGPVLRQVWVGVNGNDDEDDGDLTPDYGFSALAAGVKAELALGDDPAWRLHGWFHQGVPGIDETGFVAVGGGIEILLIDD